MDGEVESNLKNDGDHFKFLTGYYLRASGLMKGRLLLGRLRLVDLRRLLLKYGSGSRLSGTLCVHLIARLLLICLVNCRLRLLWRHLLVNDLLVLLRLVRRLCMTCVCLRKNGTIRKEEKKIVYPKHQVIYGNLQPYLAARLMTGQGGERLVDEAMLTTGLSLNDRRLLEI